MQQTIPETEILDLSNINFYAYESTYNRRQWAVRLLYVMILLSALSIVSSWMEIDLMNRFIDGERVFQDEIDRNDSREQFVGILILITYIVTGFTFLMWQYRAYRNIYALTPYGTERTPKWVVWGWIIPIISLFYPYQMIREIGRESFSQKDPQRKMGDRLVSPATLKWWWGLWLVSNQFGWQTFTSAFRADTPEALRTADYISIFDGVVGIIAAYLAIRVVEMIDDQQRRYYHRLSAAIHQPETSGDAPQPTTSLRRNLPSNWTPLPDQETSSPDASPVDRFLRGVSSTGSVDSEQNDMRSNTTDDSSSS